jgi:hypothetical protein
MDTLSGNYKSDQVHAWDILGRLAQRRGGIWQRFRFSFVRVAEGRKLTWLSISWAGQARIAEGLLFAFRQGLKSISHTEQWVHRVRGIRLIRQHRSSPPTPAQLLACSQLCGCRLRPNR